MELTPEQIEIYRRMTPDQRVSAGCALHDFAYQRLKLHLKQEMKTASEEEIRIELLRRFIGEPEGIFYPRAENP